MCFAGGLGWTVLGGQGLGARGSCQNRLDQDVGLARHVPHERPYSFLHSGTAHLDNLIAEATVDCYNESEEVTGIFTMLEENLAVPFATKLLGVEVAVERVDLNKADEMVAICRRGRERLRVPIIDLPLPEPKPKGADWIDAYRRWAQWK